MSERGWRDSRGRRGKRYNSGTSEGVDEPG